MKVRRNYFAMVGLEFFIISSFILFCVSGLTFAREYYYYIQENLANKPCFKSNIYMEIFFSKEV